MTRPLGNQLRRQGLTALRRSAVALLCLGLLAACASVQSEVRHGPVSGFSPANLRSSSPLRLEVRESQPADRNRLRMFINGQAATEGLRVTLANDLATEFGDALTATLGQRGVPVATQPSDTALVVEVTIESADARGFERRFGPPGIMAMNLGSGGLLLVPTKNSVTVADVGLPLASPCATDGVRCLSTGNSSTMSNDPSAS